MIFDRDYFMEFCRTLIDRLSCDINVSCSHSFKHGSEILGYLLGNTAVISLILRALLIVG